MPDAFFRSLLSPENNISVVLYNHVAVGEQWKFWDRCLSEHLIYFLKTGVMKANFKGKSKSEFFVEGPSLLWLFPEVPHSFDLVEGEERPLKFNLRFRMSKNTGSSEQRVLHMPKAGHLQPLVDLLHDELQQKHPWGNEVLKPYLAILYENLQRERTLAGERKLSQADQRHLGIYYRERMTSWPTVGELASVLNYTQDYFSRIFKLTFGVSPKTWMVQQRVYQGARLLSETTLSLSQVAEELGYQEVHSFARQFKQVMGKTPRHWRLEIQ